MDKKIFNKNYIFIVISATLFYVSAFMLNSVSGRYSVDLGADKTIGGVVTAVFTLSSFFTRPVWGYLSDTKSRRLVYIAGSLLCLGRVGLMVISENIMLLIAVRLLFGMGYSAVTTAGGTIVCDVTPQDLLSNAIAFYGITNVVSQAVAPGLALGLYDMGVKVLSVVLMAAVSGVILFALPVKYPEKEMTNPDRDFHIAEKTAMPRAYVVFPFAVATASVYSFVPLMAEERDIPHIWLYFTATAVALLLSRVFNSRFTEKFGRVKIFYAGCLMFTAGFVLLSFSGTIYLTVLSAILYGLGAGFVHPIVNTAAVSRCSSEKRGLATGTFMMSQDLGMTAGALLWGAVSEKAGFFAVYTAVAFCGILMALLFSRLLQKEI